MKQWSQRGSDILSTWCIFVGGTSPQLFIHCTVSSFTRVYEACSFAWYNWINSSYVSIYCSNLFLLYPTWQHIKAHALNYLVTTGHLMYQALIIAIPNNFTSDYPPYVHGITEVAL